MCIVVARVSAFKGCRQWRRPADGANSDRELRSRGSRGVVRKSVDVHGVVFHAFLHTHEHHSSVLFSSILL